MVNIGILPVCFIFGVLLRWSGRIPENASSVLNAFIINVSLPALTLLHIHNLRWDDALVYPVSMAWGMFAVGALFFVLIGCLARWSRQTIGALILTGALANTSFLGLPMIDAFFGNANGELGIGIVHRSARHLHGALDARRHGGCNLLSGQPLYCRDRKADSVVRPLPGAHRGDPVAADRIYP